MRVYVETLGCQMNVLDSELVLGDLSRKGYAACAEAADADVAIVNTCSVRQHAEDKALSLLGKLADRKRRRKLRVLGVMGCMAQSEKEGLFARVPELDFVCGPSRLGRIGDLVEEALRGATHLAETTHRIDRFPAPDHAHRPRRFQAFVEVAFGCDYACTFCIVPRTRGREVSKSVSQIVEETRRLAEDGCVEVTLIGQTVNAYGESLKDGSTFARLLEAVHAVEGIRRIKFVTSHPRSASGEMLAAMRDLPKVCEFLHLPAQSGSDRVLEGMRRLYTAGEYRETAARYREMVPEGELASDFIVGFPGETEADFRETCDLVREIGFSQSYVFKYSPRPRTIAERLDDDVPQEAKERRNRELLEIQRRVSLDRNLRKIGSAVEVLVEERNPRNAETWIGRTRQHQVCVVSGGGSLEGTIVQATVEAATALTLFAAIRPS